jgi:hypothetical protein
MSTEQKQEIVANLLRHRSLHMAFMFGQLNGVMDQNGQPIGQSGVGEMATPSDDNASIAALMQELQSLPVSENMQ